jgi:hypothetical protein
MGLGETMGLFDIFGDREQKAIKKHAARVANKRSQSPERWESIRALGQMKSREAVEALLVRFSFRIDPSISDQEEKDAVLTGVVAAGEAAVEPVIGMMKSAESIAWPLRILGALLPEERVTTELLSLLEGMDTEYERDPQKKREVLGELENRVDPRIAEAVTRFTEDVNEACRFHAYGALIAQGDVPARAEHFSEGLRREESMRVRARVLDALARANVKLVGEAPKGGLPVGYSIGKDGSIRTPR